MSVKLLDEHHKIMEFLSLKGGCTGWPESTLVKLPHCWKSHVAGYIIILINLYLIWLPALSVSFSVFFKNEHIALGCRSERTTSSKRTLGKTVCLKFRGCVIWVLVTSTPTIVTAH